MKFGTFHSLVGTYEKSNSKQERNFLPFSTVQYDLTFIQQGSRVYCQNSENRITHFPLQFNGSTKKRQSTMEFKKNMSRQELDIPYLHIT